MQPGVLGLEVVDEPVAHRGGEGLAGFFIGAGFVVVAGHRRTVKPHDLRRTYARLLFDAGMKVEAIKQNLGHANIETTLHYIGQLDASDRKPAAVLNYDLGRLGKGI